MPNDFDLALTQAISLLRELPRAQEEIPQALAAVGLFRTAHPKTCADLLVDQPPASRRVEYDLLIKHPVGGILALSWRADDGLPWAVDYADHWAANHLLSVNSRTVSIQQALLFLRLTANREPDLMTDLIDQQLIALAIAEDPPSVSEDEIQQAADEFRLASGLSTAAATRRWLEEVGLSMEQLQERLRGAMRMLKLKARVTADHVEPYFETHRERFEHVQHFRVETTNEAAAIDLVTTAAEQGLLAATQKHLCRTEGQTLVGSLLVRCARELPAELAGAPYGTLIGPVFEDGRYWVAEVVNRQPAQLDARTRAAIQDQLFREWLAERRVQAAVRWYWM